MFKNVHFYSIEDTANLNLYTLNAALVNRLSHGIGQMETLP